MTAQTRDFEGTGFSSPFANLAGGIPLQNADNPTHSVEAHLALVTPAVAGEWLARWRYPRQRTFYPRLAGMYADVMQRGEWTVSTLIVAEYTGPPTAGGLAPGTRFLVNGYHRLEAVVMADVALAFVIELHRMRNEEDIHALYAAQDRGRSRSIGDVFRSLGLADDLGWKEGDLRLVGEAQPLITNGFGASSRRGLIDPYERADFIRAWKREGRDWLDLIHMNKGVLRTYASASPVTAVALATLRHQREKAMTFWADAIRNDGLRAGTPEHALVGFLLSTRIREMRVQEYARYVAQAWNRYFRNQGLSKMMLRNPDAPIRILGTPFVPPTAADAADPPAEGEEANGVH